MTQTDARCCTNILVISAVLYIIALSSWSYHVSAHPAVSSIIQDGVAGRSVDNCSAPNDRIPLSYPIDMGIHWQTSGEWWNALVRTSLHSYALHLRRQYIIRRVIYIFGTIVIFRMYCAVPIGIIKDIR